jgi:ABC-type polysaccharide/polyol phosphate transport system ATPase subunit
MEIIDLKLDRVSKKYMVRGEEDRASSSNPWVRKLKSLSRRKKEFWALRDVNIEVRRGETFGIIGHNGAGKSTILKLLSSITAPTSGKITINGRLSALIEVGSGFHPELTGRENIYLNGSILGMRRREISEKLDSIADFGDIRQFLDVPVKRFSSGMYVRLGFSIAAHLNPHILLLDEVLAVGDAAFQKKCLERIGELKQAGTTIVFISHDLGAVERICDRVLLLRRGEVSACGDPREVIAEYQSHTDGSSLNVTTTWVTSQTAEIRSLKFQDVDGFGLPFRTGGPLSALVEFKAQIPIADVVFEILFYTADREVLCQFSTESSGDSFSIEPGTGVIEFFCPEIGLAPGLYYTDVAIKERGAPEALHWQYQSAMLRVDPGKAIVGKFYLPHSWQVRLNSDSEGVRARTDIDRVGSSR